jgi:D-lactate dehydrogenase
VGIDTGKFVKQLRARQHSERAGAVAAKLATRWAGTERAARAGLQAGDKLGGRVMRTATRAARAALGDELVPSWPQDMPPPGPARLPATTREGAAAVYLPACVNRIFGRARNGSDPGPSLAEAMVAVSGRAGVPLWIPPDVEGRCCGVPWTSKGYTAGARRMVNATIDALWRWSAEGELPIVCDASSCTLGLAAEAPALISELNGERHAKLTILDAAAWTSERLLEHLEVDRKLHAVAVHPPCASRHLETDSDLVAIAEALADEVVVPIAATCCGYAGDRGLLHPELTESATQPEAAELGGREFDAHLCSNRTCEIGLQQGTGRRYESFVFALEELTR